MQVTGSRLRPAECDWYWITNRIIGRAEIQLRREMQPNAKGREGTRHPRALPILTAPYPALRVAGFRIMDSSRSRSSSGPAPWLGAELSLGRSQRQAGSVKVANS